MFRLTIFVLTMAFMAGCGKHEAGKTSTESKDEKVVEADKKMERVGPGLAVEGYETTGRIKLSEKAVHRLGLLTGKAAFSEGAVRIGIEAVVEDRGQNFVYITEPEGWLKRVPVKVGPRLGTRIPILSGLTPGTSFVEKGAPLVRLAELDLISGEEVE